MSTREAAAGPAIVVENAVKRYGELTAVNGVSFTVPAGETFGLLGPNGAGKSTLIRMMTTLVPLSEGRVLVAGHDVARDLSIYAKLYGVPGPERRRQIAELLELVHLADRRRSLVGTLSGGMRRRVEIARGLVHSPAILFLDEPTTGLDPVSRADVWEMLTLIKRERRLTIFLTTHYMDEADRLCERIAIMDRGQLAALDTPRALKDSVPGASAIEARFESPPAEWEERLRSIPGTSGVHALGGDTWRLVVPDSGAAAAALVALAAEAGVPLRSLNVSSTTLDDVFTHYTGHGLQDHTAHGPAAAAAGRGR